MLPHVSKVLPYAYWALLLAEAAVLAAAYATAAPAPSDPLSIWLGWGGVASMVVMLVYSVARRSKRLRDAMRLSAWLHLHIFLGLQGVLFVFFHSIHLWTRLGTVIWTNPAVLSFLSVAVVFFSGLFGRYLYGWLPRTIGNAFGADQPDRSGPGRIHRIFGSWIVLHRPLAAGMFVLAALHIVLAYMFTPSLGR
jgi:hypothetical protein